MLARAGRSTQVERKRAPGARGVAERAAYEEAVGPIEAAVEARLEAEVNPDAAPVATFQLKRDSVVRRLT